MLEKKYYVVYLIPFRSDFASTMTDEERTVMNQHVAYWKEKMKEGKIIVFGPVFDPKAIYGLGILSVDNEQEVVDFIKDDPAAKYNKLEYYAMRAVLPD